MDDEHDPVLPGYGCRLYDFQSLNAVTAAPAAGLWVTDSARIANLHCPPTGERLDYRTDKGRRALPDGARIVVDAHWRRLIYIQREGSRRKRWPWLPSLQEEESAQQAAAERAAAERAAAERAAAEQAAAELTAADGALAAQDAEDAEDAAFAALSSVLPPLDGGFRSRSPSPPPPPAQFRAVVRAGGQFIWGEASVRSASVRTALARGVPTVLQIDGIPESAVSDFDAELRRVSKYGTWRRWCEMEPTLDASESVLAQAAPDTYPSGALIWEGVCKTLGVCGASPLGGATVVGSIVAATGSYVTRLHSHVPAVCKLALAGSAQKEVVLIPWEIAGACGINEMSPPLAGWTKASLLARLGNRALECWSATIGAHTSSSHNCLLWPERMLHLVVTSQPPRGRAGSSIRAHGARGYAGLGETSKRALYLGFGSYIFDPQSTRLLVSTLDVCRELPFWRSHFVDPHGRYEPDSHSAFDAWYRARVERE